MTEKLNKFKSEVEKILSSAIDNVPLGSGRYLSFDSLDVKIPKNDLESELKAKMAGQSYGTPVKAKFVLTDENTGKKESSSTRIFRMPIRTGRGTYIWNGNEINIKNQYRRKPGVYTTYSDKDGGRFQSEFNMAKGRAQFGQKINVSINPKTNGVFLNIQNTKYPMYPMMRAFGLSDSDIRESMGKDLFRENYQEDDTKVILNIAKKLTGKPFDSRERAVEAIREKFSTVSFEGGVNKLTLGKDHDAVDKEFWSDVVKKLVRTAAGIVKSDDSDASYFREYLEPEDNFLEAIKRSTGDFVRTVRQRRGKSDLKGILTNTRFDKNVNEILTKGSLKDQKKQHNPIDWASGTDSLTIYGPGGISGSRMITDEMRLLQPSLFGIADPFFTPEDADKVGVVLHRTVGSRVRGREPYVSVKDHDGKTKLMKGIDFYKSKIAIGNPGDKGKVSILNEGETKEGRSSDASHFISPESLFSYTSNMIPMLSSTYGVRAAVGAKQLGQALPLKFREAPHVESEFSEKRRDMFTQGFDMDDQGNTRSVDDGVVSSVDESKGRISVLHKDGRTTYQYPKKFPLNAESFIDNKPIVEKGDKVKKGQIIASSNFSDQGKLAIGTNLRTGFLAYKGYNFEDGFVVSEAGAKKLTSMHMHKYVLEKSSERTVSRSLYVSVFPNMISNMDVSKYDENGVIKDGSTVEYGEPLILAFEKRELTPQQAAIAAFSKRLSSLIEPRDVSIIYDNQFRGKVVRTYVDNKYVRVFIETEEPAVEGDKIATRYGGKGIITKILPDAAMPLAEDGEPLDVLFNPHGIPTRMNPSQIIESSLGKVARKTGKGYSIPLFEKDSHAKMARNELKKAGMNDEEVVTDPETGRKLDRVHVGELYFIKLGHSVRSKIKAGEIGHYDVHYEQPKKGDVYSTRAIDGMSFYSLLASGARNNLYDMSRIKSSKNDEFWRAMRYGQPLPPPKPPLSSDFFMDSLRGLGLTVERTKDFVSMHPATDKDILERSHGAIQDAKFIRSRDMKPEPGGFFDPVITGGEKGERWSHIDLSDPIPNPLFEDAIRSILGGMTERGFGEIMSGKTRVNEKGEIDENGNLYGGKAFAAILKNIDVDKSIERTRERLKGLADAKDWSKLDKENKRLRILMNVKSLKTSPDELFVLTKFPILPPRFRQVTTLPDGSVQNPPINDLYKAIKLESDGIESIRSVGYDNPDVLAQKGDYLYRHAAAAMGLQDPVSFQMRTRSSGGGIMKKLSPEGGVKEGFIQNRMLKKFQDISGGSTIVVDPNLPMDYIGIPEKIAWNIFKPFIIRKLVGIGYTPVSAVQAIEEKSIIARKKLDEVLAERPVLANRHPSLHKFNFMSQWGHVVPGDAIKLNPLVTSGYNADFDGDSMIGEIWISCDPLRDSDTGSGGTKTSVTMAITQDISELPHSGLKEMRGNRAVYRVPDGMTVPSISKDGEVSMNRITEFHVHNGCEEWDISLSSGDSILVSGDHSLACWDPETGGISKYRPEEAEGMAVPRVFGYETKNSNALPGVKMIPPSKRGEFMSCIGYFAGNLRRNKRGGGLFISKHDFFEDRVEMASAITDSRYEDNRFMCPDIEGWIASNMNIDGDLRVPAFMLGASRAMRSAFVAGFIESVLSVNRPGVVYRASRLHSFVSDVSKLMQSVGIDSRIIRYNKNDRELHELDISQPDVRDFFMENTSLFSIPARLYMSNSKIIGSIKRVRDCIPVSTFSSLMLVEMARSRLSTSEINNKMRSVYNKKPYSEWLNLGYEMWPRSLAIELYSLLSDEQRDIVPDAFVTAMCDMTVRWSIITKARRTGRVIKMYDITVENNPNFTAAGGHIVWDTMHVHVPVTEGARLEASRDLLPSKFLFGPDRMVMPMPSNEALLGLYILSKDGESVGKSFATKNAAEGAFNKGEISLTDGVSIGGRATTLGRVLLKEAIPKKYHRDISGKIFDKDLVQSLVKKVYKDDPSAAATMLNDFKDMGNKYTYLSGFSVSLADIETPKDMSTYLGESIKAFGGSNEMSEELNNAIGRAQKKFGKFFDGNRLYDMQRSGAKGTWNSVSQILMAPGYMEGKGGALSEKPVSTGYAEGMNAHDYLNTLYAARSGDIGKARGTGKGGELAKNEVHAAIEVVVSIDDCGTTNGISMSKSDPYIIGRWTAKTDKQIDETYLKKIKTTNILVRSPLTCEAARGVCAKCYGLNDQMNPAKIGDHVGIEAAQNISSSITQRLLRSFHSGRGRGLGTDIPLEKKVSNLFGKMPMTFAQEAPVARESGLVTGVNKSPAGGWDIFVDDNKYHGGSLVDPVVAVGNRVRPGDALTTGMKHPRAVMETEGLMGVRKYLASSMRKIYEDNSAGMNPTHFEIISRALTEHGRVTDPGTSQYEIGDMETISTIEKLNRDENYGINYIPVMRGADTIPTLRKNFLAQTARREIKRAIQGAASTGEKAEIHGLNPLNSWMLGEFESKPGPFGEY